MKTKVLVSTVRGGALNVVAIESGVELKSRHEWVISRGVKWKEEEGGRMGKGKSSSSSRNAWLDIKRFVSCQPRGIQVKSVTSGLLSRCNKKEFTGFQEST